MNKKKLQTRSIWAESGSVFMVEQNLLPFEFKIIETKTCIETCEAIKNMTTRGAGSIGAAAGFAMMQATFESEKSANKHFLQDSKNLIEATRPTARDLFAAVNRVYKKALISTEAAEYEAHKIANEIAYAGKKIGEFGNVLIKNNFKILTHCNAGWLALVEHGSALAPVYEAHREGKNLFVYVDETRPRCQGAKLTAWELNKENIPHAIIPDNAAAWLMKTHKIDIVITGADRIAANGDTANKIGTLEKAICAKYFGIPFYIAAPISTFDFECKSGNEIPIEERNHSEVLFQTGKDENNDYRTIRIASPDSGALNPSFDVTPTELITGYITEKGIFTPDKFSKLK